MASVAIRWALRSLAAAQHDLESGRCAVRQRQEIRATVAVVAPGLLRAQPASAPQHRSVGFHLDRERYVAALLRYRIGHVYSLRVRPAPGPVRPAKPLAYRGRVSRPRAHWGG